MREGDEKWAEEIYRHGEPRCILSFDLSPGGLREELKQLSDHDLLLRYQWRWLWRDRDEDIADLPWLWICRQELEQRGIPEGQIPAGDFSDVEKELMREIDEHKADAESESNEPTEEHAKETDNQMTK